MQVINLYNCAYLEILEALNYRPPIPIVMDPNMDTPAIQQLNGSDTVQHSASDSLVQPSNNRTIQLKQGD